VIAVTVQSIFCLKMHQNKVFFLKKIILISTHQNDMKTLKKIYFKQKKSNFLKILFARCQTLPILVIRHPWSPKPVLQGVACDPENFCWYEGSNLRTSLADLPLEHHLGGSNKTRCFAQISIVPSF
jgi:hypothetical protein